MSPRSIVVAPDKFKGSLPALEVARAIERGFRHVLGDRYAYALVPMADGGEGTVAAFLESGARAQRRTVGGPLGAPVTATFALDGDRAILEMAAASGLALVPQADLDARAATTFGTGELILAALDAGARHIVVGIGGSATTDGGAGMLVALGARLLDAAGDPLAPGGAALSALAAIDLRALDPRLRRVRIDVAADVDNPLCGERGAAVVFGPQKGATPADVVALDAALAHFARLTAATVGTDHRDVPGAGAAGGLGYGLTAFLGAAIRPGVEIVAELRGLETSLEQATLCVTGEGRIDTQTLRGKTVAGVARIAQRHGVPVVALAGTLAAGIEDPLFAAGITCLPVVEGPMELSAAMSGSAGLIERAAARLGRGLLLARAR